VLDRSAKQELANSLTHGFGLLGCLVAVPLLMTLAAQSRSRTMVLACAVYGLSLLLVYTASTVYHGIPHPGVKWVLRRIDHVAIYALIAGSYTPLVLLYLPPELGWPFLGALWTLSLAGSVYKIGWLGRYPRAALAFYVALGCAALLVIRPLAETLPPMAFRAVLAGGACYLGGVVFFTWKRYTYHHAIWHVFVLGGSAFHFVAILHGVLKA
jgi:hemolysin III